MNKHESDKIELSNSQPQAEKPTDLNKRISAEGDLCYSAELHSFIDCCRWVSGKQPSIHFK